MNKYYLIAFVLLISNLPASAQWAVVSGPGSPIPGGVNVPHVASDYASDHVYVFTRDTSYHFYEYTRGHGWVSHPESDSMLAAVNAIYDIKVRHDMLWCLTSGGLKNYANGTWTDEPYPAGFFPGTNGLVIDEVNTLWFPGGINNKGITHFTPGGSWEYYNNTTHPAFIQDNGITDLKLDEEHQALWIATNCFTQASGVYAYSLITDRFTRYDYGDPKYACTHTVQPAKGKVFVGTANFSSLRIIETGGIYGQSLDAPRVRWATEMRLDPADSSAVWLLTDIGLMHVKDTAHYLNFDTANTALKGYGNELTLEKLPHDSICIWVGTSRGLFTYTYKGDEIRVGTGDLSPDVRSVTVYPNPSAGVFTLGMHNLPDIAVTDLTGKKVNAAVSYSPGNTHIDLSGKPAGVYFVRFTLDGGTASRKLMLTE